MVVRPWMRYDGAGIIMATTGEIEFCEDYPCCVIYDTFTDSDSTALSAHTMDTGHSWTAIDDDDTVINSNKAKAAHPSGPDDYGYGTDLGITCQHVSCSINNNSSGPSGILIRGDMTSSTDFIGVVMTDDYGFGDWELRVATVSTTFPGEYTYTAISNDYTYNMGSGQANSDHDLEVKITATTIKVWLDGVLRIDEITSKIRHLTLTVYLTIDN